MTLISVQPRRWTREEYRRLGEVGMFEGERVELIRGEIVPMSPHDPLHSGAIENLSAILFGRFGESHVVRIQLPFCAPDDSEPEPDALVLTREAARDFRRARCHPDQALLVVEVANTSLAYDRLEKLSLYAEAGVPDYWIVNLVDFVVEVYRQPRQNPASPFGWDYAQKEVVLGEGSLFPLFSGAPLPAARVFADLT